jgi:hypothetical protein
VIDLIRMRAHLKSNVLQGVPLLPIDGTPSSWSSVIWASPTACAITRRQRAEARGLATELGYLPLALKQAGAYLAQNRGSPSTAIAAGWAPHSTRQPTVSRRTHHRPDLGHHPPHADPQRPSGGGHALHRSMACTRRHRTQPAHVPRHRPGHPRRSPRHPGRLQHGHRHRHHQQRPPPRPNRPSAHPEGNDPRPFLLGDPPLAALPAQILQSLQARTPAIAALAADSFPRRPAHRPPSDTGTGA